MSADAIQRLFAELADPRVRTALAPLAALGLGVLLVLLLDLSDATRRARSLALVASLAAAAWFQLAVLRAPIGPVLYQTYDASAGGALWGLLVIGATLLAWMASVGYYRSDHTPFLGEHDALMLSACAGMTLMAGALELSTFFVGLELLSIPLYALAAFRRSRRASVEAGLKYFLLGAFASALFLYGTALIYAESGTLALAALRAAPPGSALGLAGVALLVAAVFFKVSVFPFHLWVPDVYQGSPTPVTALMATGTKAAGFGFLLNASFLLPRESAPLVAVLALLTMAVGNLGALVQGDLKRLLAWSGIAHAGTVLLAVAAERAGDPQPGGALQAGLFYLGVYTVTAAGAFGCLAWLERIDERATRLDALRGLARTHPAIAAALALFMLSLGGIPGSGGFWGKWLVFSALVRADQIAVAIAGVLLSVVALGYYLRVIVVLYMQPAPEGEAPRAPRAIASSLVPAACAALVLATGFLPGWFLEQLP